jgi:NTP pyrophosphatase (non-canonical NTP hydrolase)
MNYSRSESDVGLGAGATAVICGSFRRDRASLRREFLDLQAAGCTVLSPRDLDFVDEVDGFVYGQNDWGKSTAEIEQMHLRSMEKADLVWLHCPEGYVGTSAAMELGFARAIGLRVFASERPIDTTLADLVQLCESPRDAAEVAARDFGEAPAHALPALQSYYARAAQRRGWSGEGTDLTLKLLRGEVEELEEALVEDPGGEAARLELADVQLYVVHLANMLRADLGEAVRVKEKINAARFETASEQVAV